MAENRREFQQLARMRLRDARVLMRHGNLEAAYYLTGRAVECAVKACIAKGTKRRRVRVHSSVHITRRGETYSLIYTPYSGPGGAVPSVSVHGDTELLSFLQDKLHLSRRRAESVLREFEYFDTFGVTNVELKHGELRRIGLA
jgi:hypothetical protein